LRRQFDYFPNLQGYFFSGKKESSVTIEQYQNVIIGSGEAGKYIAWTLARKGQRSIVVERKMIGGSCPNVACLPSKNVIFSAKAGSLARRGEEFGIITGPIRTDMARVIARKKKMVDGLIAMHLDRFGDSGAELLMGEGRFIAPKTVQVALNDGGTRVLQGERVFINVGSRASIPPVLGLAEANPLTHVEALDLNHLPGHLVVLGGGYVGLEFAQAMRRFGSRVTIIQHGPQLLAGQDPDVVTALQSILESEGIQVLLSTTVTQVSGTSGQKVMLDIGSRMIDATDILVATGRTPNGDQIDAAKGGVEITAKGFIKVNDKLETTAAGVWATGDCAGSPHFTHVGFDDFRIVRDNLAGGNRTTTGRLIPSCLFTDPELAQIGLNESEAKSRGIPYRLAKLPMLAIFRAQTIAQKRGFIKALVAADSDRILGFTALGAEASELLAAVQTAMLGGLPYTVFRDGIYTHPTMAEGLTSLFAGVPAR
jgi:pyruvate/2-oxoglutarate dehydrogenase complex dihydrolipoamide dehydrogenase (E3) component